MGSLALPPCASTSLTAAAARWWSTVFFRDFNDVFVILAAINSLHGCSIIGSSRQSRTSSARRSTEIFDHRDRSTSHQLGSSADVPRRLVFLDSAEFDGVLVIQRGARRPHHHQKICLSRKRLSACSVYKLRKRTMRQQTIRPWIRTQMFRLSEVAQGKRTTSMRERTTLMSFSSPPRFSRTSTRMILFRWTIRQFWSPNRWYQQGVSLGLLTQWAGLQRAPVYYCWNLRESVFYCPIPKRTTMRHSLLRFWSTTTTSSSRCWSQQVLELSAVGSLQR